VKEIVHSEHEGNNNTTRSYNAEFKNIFFQHTRVSDYLNTKYQTADWTKEEI